MEHKWSTDNFTIGMLVQGIRGLYEVAYSKALEVPLEVGLLFQDLSPGVKIARFVGFRSQEGGSTPTVRDSNMNDLGLEIDQLTSLFPHEQESPFIFVRVNQADAQTLAVRLGLAFRRCYIADSRLIESSTSRQVPQLEVIAARLPDAGATMAGDFGEILVYLYQGARQRPRIALGATKWRLKQDRTKPAPHSDVLHLVLHSWPTASDQDTIVCSEVKTKSTNGSSTPIVSAIADSAKDRTSRLMRTLVWLRERALTETLGDITLAHLERFINATDYPPAKKLFNAVAVICTSLVDDELARAAPTEVHPDYTVVVIAVPELQATYTSVFAAAQNAVAGASVPVQEPAV